MREARVMREARTNLLSRSSSIKECILRYCRARFALSVRGFYASPYGDFRTDVRCLFLDDPSEGFAKGRAGGRGRPNLQSGLFVLFITTVT
jgi:hypothetical protein